MLVRMRVAGLRVDPSNGAPVVVLLDESGGLALPIWIGASEAHAIAVQLESIRLERPLTHDLLGALLARLGGELARVEVHDLREETFYAALHVRRGPETFEIDARPSDAIALALRTGAPIFAAREVIDRVHAAALARDPAAQILSSLPDAAYGKWKH